MTTSKKIALTMLGSLGDLHPLLGLARALQHRHYAVTIATSASYQSEVEEAGCRFHPVAPDLNPADPQLIDAVLDPRKGPERLHKGFIFPALQQSVADFLPLAQDVDLIISGVLAYFAPICAALVQKPWVSALLSPLSFWSAYDPPILAPLPWLGRLRKLGPRFHRLALRLLWRISEPWARPVQDLRRQLGLPAGGNPFVEGLYAPDLVLALFSRVFTAKQPDWPAQTRITGFIFYDRHAQHVQLEPHLARFLSSGVPPLIFTLGSTTVLHLGKLFDRFIETAQVMGKRAVILVGNTLYEHYKERQSPQLVVGTYAPYSLLMPRGACIIHQGGVGTTAQAMLSGNPMLVLPACNDQFDNAARVKRLGIASVLPQRHLTTSRIVHALDELLGKPHYARQAQAVRAQILTEDGPSCAVNAIEETFGWQ